MLTRHQRNQIPTGVERFNHDHTVRDLINTERLVIDAALNVSARLHDLDKPIDGLWDLIMELDRNCVALADMQKRVDETPPLPEGVEGWLLRGEVPQ